VKAALDNILSTSSDIITVESLTKLDSRVVSLVLSKGRIKDELILVSLDGFRVHLKNINSSDYFLVSKDDKLVIPPKVRRNSGPFKGLEFLIDDGGITVPFDGSENVL